MKRFKRCLHEGEWKILTGFSVVLVNTEIRLTEVRRKIALTSNTQVTHAEDSDAFIPLDMVPYDFVSNLWNDQRTSFPRDVENGEGLSFLVVDDEGTRMHAFVQHFADAKRFKRLLQKETGSR
ncbi:unnamed protein product [Microthlaspi erraticum]|uniref:Replication protein A 70 kDa DNA-binding subunit B/D first OB fold domain-containing protein n=1 Tax=Microthlaspi erraticum TaxID=1685480 RepID=A0A6D2JSF5_9BRAS|nr:unnamed protein product [Microthlaspi erraticum]